VTTSPPPTMREQMAAAKVEAVRNWPTDGPHIHMVFGTVIQPFAKIDRGRYPEDLAEYAPDQTEGGVGTSYKMRYPSTVRFPGKELFLLPCKDGTTADEAVMAVGMLPVPEVVTEHAGEIWPVGVPSPNSRLAVAEALERYAYELALFTDAVRGDFSRKIRRRFVLS
jgi:hypothetical protein